MLIDAREWLLSPKNDLFFPPICLTLSKNMHSVNHDPTILPHPLPQKNSSNSSGFWKNNTLLGRQVAWQMTSDPQLPD